MSEVLEVTYRKAGVEYHREETPGVGAWNPDASPATLGKFDFSEVKNLRQVTQGSLVVRTPPKLYQIPGFTTGTIIAKCQFRTAYRGSSDRQLDVTLFYSTNANPAGEYYMAFLDPATSVTNDPTTILVRPCPEFGSVLLTGWMTQFKLSLIITLKGNVGGNNTSDGTGGTYELWSTDKFAAPTFSVVTLGKDVCPTPTKIGFLEKTTGDLFMIDNTGTAGHFKMASYFKPDPAWPKESDYQYALLPLAINCDYFINANGAFSLNDPRFFVHGNTDVSASAPDNVNSNLQHNQSRAWGYRFCAVMQYTDPNGNFYDVISQASVDQWVPDVCYGPAQWVANLTDGQISSIGILLDPNGNAWCTPTGVGDKVEIIGLPPVTATAPFLLSTQPSPSLADWQRLQTAVIKLLDPNALTLHSVGVSDPYFWLAEYFLFVRPGNNDNFGGDTPFLRDVPASLVAKAPLTTFDIASFDTSGLAGTLKEIRIYRTAHSGPDDTKNASLNPSFAKNTYGYVGSLFPDSPKFTDNVIDDAIQFDITPGAQDSYLRGEFSGNIVTEYNNALVIGDVVTDYRVLPPASPPTATPSSGSAPSGFWRGPIGTVQGFWYLVTDKSPVTNYVLADETNVTFYAAYVDTNGYQSDIAPISMVNSGSAGGSDKLWASFTFPRGYAPSIVSMNLYKKVVAGLVTTWYQCGTFNLDTGTYVSQNNETNVVGAPTGNIIRSEERGAIVYSAPNQEFFWPPLNSWIVHSFAPVTALESITGPLWVFTDQSVHLTDLGLRKEDETRFVGCISRFASAKVNKIVMFLSSRGLSFAEASGILNLPHSVNTIILEYLQESIPGVAPLANLRRASMGWLHERMEMFLWLPSSKDLGGTLPQRLIIFRYSASGNVREARWLGMEDFLSSIVCYEFDFTPDFALRDITKATGGHGTADGTTTTFSDAGSPVFTSGSAGKPIGIIVNGVLRYYSITAYVDATTVTLNEPLPAGSNYMWFLDGAPQTDVPAVLDTGSLRSDTIIFNQHIDGGLFSAYFDLVNPGLFVVDNDDPTRQWQGITALEKYWPMGEPMLRKDVTEVTLRADGNFAMKIMQGQADSSGNRTVTYGATDRRVKISTVLDNRSPIRKRVGAGLPSYERASTAPLTRFVTTPDQNGNHSVEYMAIGLDIAPVGNHP